MNEQQDYIRQKISLTTSKLIGNAVDNIIKDFPLDSKEEFLTLLIRIEEEGIDAIIEDYQEQVERTTYEYAVQLATRHTESALKQIQKKLPRGKTRDKVFVALNEMANKGIESFCSGKALAEVKTELAEIAKVHLNSYIEEQSHVYGKIAGKKIYMRLKFKGRGSRKKNRHLRNATELFANELSFQITDNLGAWIDGEHDLIDAAGNIVVCTGKNTAVEYTRQHGAELAVEAVKELSKLAEKKIENEVIRNGAVKTLNKLSDSQTLTGVAGTVYDIGNAFKQLINGEISKADFLREVGEEGTGAVVSGVYATFGTTIGTILAGPAGGMVGGAIGSAVGYFANSLLYGSVLKAFEDAELARKRYETMHVFCEYYIDEMERQRQEFEREVAQFLSGRQQVIEYNLNQFESALKRRDFNSISLALNNIAKEFGGELPFKNFEEFDSLMTDKDSCFEL